MADDVIPPINGTAPAGRPRRGNRWRGPALDMLLPALALLAIFAFWQAYVVVEHVPTFLFPRLDDTLHSLADNFGDIWSSLLTTLQEAAWGFLIGNLAAILGASIFVHSRFAERTFFPVAVIVQTIPIIVWSPILVIVFPTDSLYPQIGVSFLITFFPALVNMTRGLREVDPLHLELFRLLNATRWQVYRKLRWPGAIPALFATLRITSTLSLIGAIVGEYVAGGGQGLGYDLITAKQSLDTAKVMAITLATSVTGVIIFLVVAGLERAVLRRRGM
ncbi:MAG TPA: ABC transporter permease [Chloroflexota bacterium]|nr:ABC transporter permease [Chloroflexota bacterium]